MRLKSLAAGVLVILIAVPPLAAEERRDADAASTVPAAVRSETFRRSVAREATRLAEGRGQAAPAVQTASSRSWIGEHPVLAGALVGATGGVVWGDLVCRGQCEGDPRPYMALFGGAGAGIGAGVGAVIAAIRR